MSVTQTESKVVIKTAVIVAALGYFVDVYDLILFSIVRVPSLQSLGLSGEELLSNGVYLLNMQMIGMLLGGIIFGILGDKKGRVQVLFGSILLYSLANLANAFVYDVHTYAILRLLAGIGLAGEIGAGITLVSEMMPKETRGYATTLVATVGVSGAIAAALVGDLLSWRVAYLVGAAMGFGLLALRIGVNESGMFKAAQQHSEKIVRGDLRLIFNNRHRFMRLLNCLFVGVPIWYVIGIIITFCPEIGVALGATSSLKASTAVLYYSIGITTGDLLSGLLSQYLQSRKKVIGLFLAACLATCIVVLNLKEPSANLVYGMMIPLGFFIGYWAVLVTTAAEQFGTNLRATVTTCVPNLVRGSTVIVTLSFNALKPSAGVIGSAQIVGLVVFALAFTSLWMLRETFGRDLNFYEEHKVVKLPSKTPAMEGEKRRHVG